MQLPKMYHMVAIPSVDQHVHSFLWKNFETEHEPDTYIKVTVDLQGCLPKNHLHARLLCYNHRKAYIIVKLIKFRI